MIKRVKKPRKHDLACWYNRSVFYYARCGMRDSNPDFFSTYEPIVEEHRGTADRIYYSVFNYGLTSFIERCIIV